MEKTKPVVLIKNTQKDDAEGSWLSSELAKDLRKYFHIVCLSEINDDPSLLSKIQGLLILPTNVSMYVELIPKMPSLKAIVVPGAGYDNYYPILKPFGIPVANTPYAVRDGMADFTMALVLNTGCHITQGISIAMQESPPRKHSMRMYQEIPGVAQKTLGIIGMGRIGLEVAKRAEVFNMNILYHSRHRIVRDTSFSPEFYGSLPDMLPQCDYVVVLCPLTSQTRGLIGKNEFELMKKSAIFINVARGEVVDQEALVEALTLKTISFAALDVTYPEPLPEGHPLLKLDNVIITPHSGASAHVTWKNLVQTSIDNLKAALIEHKTMPYLITE